MQLKIFTLEGDSLIVPLSDTGILKILMIILFLLSQSLPLEKLEKFTESSSILGRGKNLLKLHSHVFSGL